MAKAVGIIEVYGLVAAFVAGDAGCKAANVTVENFDKNKKLFEEKRNDFTGPRFITNEGVEYPF